LASAIQTAPNQCAVELIPDLTNWDLKILATDVSPATVQQAERATYPPHDLSRSQRPQAMTKWFDQTPQGASPKPQLKRLVTFKPHNLLQPLPAFGPFDVIFLRNVLIYFDAATRLQVLNRVRSALLPHGWLVLGGTENLNELAPDLVPEVHCRATVYRSVPLARV
jgi:chemotaxis protein methyltransferase CheR